MPGETQPGNQLSSVSCSDALDCTAVGSAELPTPEYPQGVTEPAAATESNGVWSPLTEVPAPSEIALDQGSSFSSVSCTSVGNCVAVGYGYASYIDGYDHPLAAAEVGGVWSTYEVGTTDIAGIISVSSADSTHCTAVTGAFPDDAIAFSVAGGSLSAPTIIGSGWLMGVDCIAANDCVAVNNSTADVYLVESDGIWAPVPVNHTSGWLSSVSCTSVSDCTSIGPGSGGGGFVITNTPTVSVADNHPIVGHDLTFTATVTGTDAPAPTGAVTWTVGGPGAPSCSSTTGPVSAGNVSTYTCTVTGEPAGSFDATASFGGDAQYAATSGEDANAIAGPSPAPRRPSPRRRARAR